MADMALPTIVEGNNGFGGAGMGAGFIGGLVLGSIWNGGFGGWGGNRAGQVGADVALAGSIQNVANQVQAGTISQLQSAAGVTGAVNQQTIANLQGQNAIQQQMCCATGRLSQEIDNTGDQTVAAINATNLQMTNGMANLGQAITSQGYESRLQAQSLAAQLQSQHAELSRQIFEENCKDRELQREIQAQNVRDQLTQAQAQNAALTAQINLTNQLTAQTAYLIDRLTPTTTTTAAAGA